MNRPSCGFTAVYLLALSWNSAAHADDTVRLEETFTPGYQYHVSSRVDLGGSLALPPEKDKSVQSLPVTGDSAIEYDERVLKVSSSGVVEKTCRIYRRMEFQRKVGDKPQANSLRPGVRRLVLLRHQQVEVPFSPDGPMTWGELDLVRTDVFTPALVGLLPAGPVRPGERWTAAGPAVQELTDLERIEEGKIECRLEQVSTLHGRRLARVALLGAVRGVNEDGPNRQHLDGYYLFDLESRHLTYLSIKGMHVLLDKDGKEQGRVEGRFVLTRQAHQRSADLTDDALKGVALEPNDDNTRLLYDNPDLGLRLLHPRRWRLAGVKGTQLGLDETDGSGLMITLETPERTPSGAQFLAESRGWLKEQKATVVREYAPQTLQAAPRQLEHFAISADMMGQRAFLDYYVVRQALGGATVVARLQQKDLEHLRKEVERIAQSIAITRPIVAAKK